jgi:prepilin-type N-terminal cleavage/methylation domain-containing protein
MKPSVQYQAGFTLIELAIVLVIIGVLVGSFIGTIGARIDTTRRAEAISELDEIKQAILGYAYSAANPVLPCPCTTNCDLTGTSPLGVEDRTGGRCTSGTNVGVLPWGTLGLAHTDPWNVMYRYWVSPDFGDDGSVTGTPFDLDSNATGNVRTRSPDGTSTPLIANKAAFVVFTHGKNNYGGTGIDGNAQQPIPAAKVDEADNADGNSEFISRAPTEVGAVSDGGEFDDIVIWMSEYELKAKMVEIGKLP